VLPPDTADLDALLWHFAGPLPPDRRAAFFHEARDALTRLHCVGPGVVHRTLAELLRVYFIPVPDDVHNIGPNHRLPSKLAALPPLA
jgi:hypothetical protein